jgi:hypothetical protein
MTSRSLIISTNRRRLCGITPLYIAARLCLPSSFKISSPVSPVPFTRPREDAALAKVSGAGAEFYDLYLARLWWDDVGFPTSLRFTQLPTVQQAQEETEGIVKQPGENIIIVQTVPIFVAFRVCHRHRWPLTIEELTVLEAKGRRPRWRNLAQSSTYASDYRTVFWKVRSKKR